MHGRTHWRAKPHWRARLRRRCSFNLSVAIGAIGLCWPHAVQMLHAVEIEVRAFLSGFSLGNKMTVLNLRSPLWIIKKLGVISIPALHPYWHLHQRSLDRILLRSLSRETLRLDGDLFSNCRRSLHLTRSILDCARCSGRNRIGLLDIDRLIRRRLWRQFSSLHWR